VPRPLLARFAAPAGLFPVPPVDGAEAERRGPGRRRPCVIAACPARLARADDDATRPGPARKPTIAVRCRGAPWSPLNNSASPSDPLSLPSLPPPPLLSSLFLPPAPPRLLDLTPAPTPSDRLRPPPPWRDLAVILHPALPPRRRTSATSKPAPCPPPRRATSSTSPEPSCAAGEPHRFPSGLQQRLCCSYLARVPFNLPPAGEPPD
jgi:hypothetical protein